MDNQTERIEKQDSSADSPDPVESFLRKYLNKRITRRRFAAEAFEKSVTGVLGYSATESLLKHISSLARKAFSRHENKPAPKPDTTPVAQVTTDTKPTPTLTPSPTPELPPDLEIMPDTDLLNWILSHPPGNKGRARAEEVYAERAKTLEQVDKGLWVLAKSEQRAKLLNRRFDLRQNSEDAYTRSKLTKLSPDLIDWAKEDRVPWEVLGICLDTYPIARRIIQKLLDKSIVDFRPDILDPDREDILPPEILEEAKIISNNPQNYHSRLKHITAELFMINAGGMAMLMNYETGGFVNIGNGAALSEINHNLFLDADKQLEEIAKIASQITGLKFHAKNIPGSLWTPGNISGGAISAQIMPGAVLVLNDLFESVGEKLNIFHPSWAVIASWVFLARSQIVGQNKQGKKIYREGWGNFAELPEYGLGKWNQHPPQIRTVLRSTQSYFHDFLENNLRPY